jgi:hypothetical protein
VCTGDGSTDDVSVHCHDAIRCLTVVRVHEIETDGCVDVRDGGIQMQLDMKNFLHLNNNCLVKYSMFSQLDACARA